ncbi:hypothetical protein ACJQWK_01020 [Exserohilum turcicum]|uniref:Uncharacterized protein n=1 Tax=Exserohilum turcicum (strain 28A) TaxID=671987 RepID=R0IF61_EXST2|nr:uncharacterized protein SETTUDRAFT_92738 [Exserohilum turcica Et28A]EOA83701.1 hypothetical protein SETTUDRAFT_92738 [Exserohilum turcica Et28A]
MAAPPSKTLHTLSGQWALNRTYSGDFSQILALQGINILIRKAATSASIQLKISQPDDYHVSMYSSMASGRIPGKTEEYTLDYEWRAEKDALFGEVVARSRWISTDDARATGVVSPADEAWLESGADAEGRLIYGEARKEGKWEASHLWGFELINGQRRHVRRVRARSAKGQELRVRMVYDFVSE